MPTRAGSGSCLPSKLTGQSKLTRLSKYCQEMTVRKYLIDNHLLKNRLPGEIMMNYQLKCLQQFCSAKKMHKPR